MLAKINVARQLANNLDITIINALATQRRNRAQRGTQPDRPQINVQVQRLAQAQQDRFRTLIESQPVPLRSTNRAKQNRISGSAARQRLGWQRRAELFNRGSAKRVFAEFKFVFERFRAVSEDLYRGMRYFGPDSVARQHRDGFPYSRHDINLP